MTDGPPETPAASLPSWPDDVLHRLVFAEIERMWRESCRPGWLARRRSPQVSGRPLFVQRFSDVNWRATRFLGQPEATYAYCGRALAAVDPAELLDVPGEEGFRRYRYPILAFAVHPDGERVLLARYWGPRVASAARLRVIGAPGQERFRFEEL